MDFNCSRTRAMLVALRWGIMILCLQSGDAVANPFPLLLPQPKVMEIKDSSTLTLVADDDVRATLVVNRGVHKTVVGAAEINKEIRKLGFKGLPVVGDDATDNISGHVLIVIGSAAVNRMTAQLFTNPRVRARNTIAEAQGYTIDFVRDDRDRDCVVISGCDEQGTLYGAVTFYQMLETHEDALDVRKVFVKDWPDFKYRINSKFNTATRRRCGIQQYRDYIDWLLKHKINWMHGSIRYTDESVLKQAIGYAKERGIGVMSSFFGETGPTNAVGRVADLEKHGDVKDMWRSRRHRKFYVSYVRDDLLRRRAETDARRAAELGLDLVLYHAIDTGSSPDNYSEWGSRTDACKKRFGEDRAAADAHCINIVCDAYKQLAPDAKLIFCIIPYYTYVMSDEFPRNIEPEIADVYAKLYQQKVRTYFRDLCRWTPPDIAISLREGNRKSVDDWITHVPKQAHFYVLLCDSDYALAQTRARYLASFYRRDRADLIVVHGLAMRQQTVENIVLQLIVQEYLWNTDGPGAADWPDVFFDYVGDVSEPQAILAELVPRVCDNIWGKDGGKYFYKLFQSKLVPGFIENSEKFQRSRGPRGSGTLADGAKAAITYKTANAHIFFPPAAADTMKAQMDALPAVVRDLEDWLVHHKGKDNDPYSYRHGTHYYKRAVLWRVYSQLWYSLLAADQAISSGDRDGALALLETGLVAARTARSRLNQAHALARKHPHLYSKHRALHELITVEQLQSRLQKQKDAVDR